ncbi:MAG: outer membrane beta-barrel protein [Acidobacteriota bacterium]|nr:outer membrane beta-barrel protein [Acidobacteriota bacterium]MDQ7088128.1 outer membrane beta-barrel protein [Acidobacteriota bacterium]
MGSAARRGIVAVLGLLALAVGLCGAQTPTRDAPFPELTEARRWGPFMVDPGWTIDNIGYDGNIYLVPSGVPKETDWFIRTGPDVRAQIRFGRRMALTVRERFILDLYANHSTLNQTSNDFEGQFDLLLGPVLLTTRGHWTTSFGRPNSEIDERTRLDRITLEEKARLFIGSRTDISASASVERLRFDDPDFRFRVAPPGSANTIELSIESALNRDRKRFDVEWGWRPRGRTRIFLAYSLRRDDFISDTLGRDVEEKRRTIGLEFAPSAFLSGKFEFGMSRLENQDPAFGYKPYDGTVSDTQLVYRPTGTTRFLADFERNVRFSTFDNNLYFRETLKGLRLESYLGGTWGVQLGGSVRNLDYPEKNTLTPPIGEFRRDEITDVFAGLLVRLPGGVNFSLRVGRRQRRSNVIFAEDDQTYFSTSSTYRF